MSISKTNPPSEPVSVEDPPGYLERAVFWIKYSVCHVTREDGDTIFKNRLLEQIKNHMICPTVLEQQFVRLVPKLERSRVFEDLGKKKPLSARDRFLNWIWRDLALQRKRYREIGKEMARQNPYLLAPSLERELSKKTPSTSCECVSFPS